MSLFKIFTSKLSILLCNRNKANIMCSTRSVLSSSLSRYCQTAVSPPIVEEAVSLVKEKPKKTIWTVEEKRESEHFSDMLSKRGTINSRVSHLYSQLHEVEYHILNRLFPEFGYILDFNWKVQCKFDTFFHFDLSDYFREQQDPRFSQIAENSNEFTALKEFFDTSKGTNSFHEMMRSDDYYDSKLLKLYLEKATSFAIRYNFLELNTFIDRNFDDEFWELLEYVAKENLAYNEYFKKLAERNKTKY